MISKNVMKTLEFEDEIFYRVVCGCGSDDHDISIHFERAKDIPHMFSLNFYKNVAWCDNFGNLNFFQRIWKRISGSFVILFRGYIETEEAFMIDVDNIDGFIEALQEGKKGMSDKAV